MKRFLCGFRSKGSGLIVVLKGGKCNLNYIISCCTSLDLTFIISLLNIIKTFLVSLQSYEQGELSSIYLDVYFGSRNQETFVLKTPFYGVSLYTNLT